jgi:hypothetical protein
MGKLCLVIGYDTAQRWCCSLPHTSSHILQISVAAASIFRHESDYNFRVHEWATKIVFVAFVNEATTKVCFGTHSVTANLLLALKLHSPQPRSDI